MRVRSKGGKTAIDETKTRQCQNTSSLDGNDVVKAVLALSEHRANDNMAGKV
jgi:hypothetical protein